MPLVKQGKFKEYYNNCDNIENDFSSYREQYFNDDNEYNSNMDIISDFAYAVNGIYMDAKEMKHKLEGLSELSEQKTKGSVEKCKGCIRQMDSIISKCTDDFEKIVGYLNGDITEAEKDTLQNLEIYRR